MKYLIIPFLLLTALADAQCVNVPGLGVGDAVAWVQAFTKKEIIITDSSYTTGFVLKGEGVAARIRFGRNEVIESITIAGGADVMAGLWAALVADSKGCTNYSAGSNYLMYDNTLYNYHPPVGNATNATSKIVIKRKEIM